MAGRPMYGRDTGEVFALQCSGRAEQRAFTCGARTSSLCSIWDGECIASPEEGRVPRLIGQLRAARRLCRSDFEIRLVLAARPLCFARLAMVVGVV